MWRSSIVSLFVVVSLLTATPAADQPGVGDRHPDFTLANIDDGKPVSLSDFRGKKVLLIQFASW